MTQLTITPVIAPDTAVSTEVQERVARGASLLDMVLPDWYKHVDIEVLTLSSCEACVLGQMYGDYLDGLEELFSEGNPNPNADAADHGFTLNGPSDPATWFELEVAWLNEIHTRKAK